MKRVIFDIVLFISVFTMPWWLTVILAFVGIFSFKHFYEFIIVGIVMYSLFAIPGTNFISNPVYVSLIIGIVYIGIQYLRSNMIIYNNEI
ncbi:MAG: hypothetical protein AAB895_00535 [Patescibacteria group bacterium]